MFLSLTNVKILIGKKNKLGRVTTEGSPNNVSINRNYLLPDISPLLPVSSLKEKSGAVVAMIIW
jgi:hypothetical protein